MVVVSGTVVGTVSGVESATSGAKVSTTESATVDSTGTAFEPLGVSFSEQLAKIPANVAKQMMVREILTTPQ